MLELMVSRTVELLTELKAAKMAEQKVRMMIALLVELEVERMDEW